jgi:hypothetical protein
VLLEVKLIYYFALAESYLSLATFVSGNEKQNLFLLYLSSPTNEKLSNKNSIVWFQENIGASETKLSIK